MANNGPARGPAREVSLPLPLAGYDAGRAYSEQPRKTTPAAINVRAYSTDEERARIGSRPGVVPGYSGRLGNSAKPVQWLGWLDYGFGDTVFYDEPFDYDAGTLKTRTGDSVGGTAWPGATTRLSVADGYVHITGGSGTNQTGGSYGLFAADDWDDFTLEAGVQWNQGTAGGITFWVSSNAQNPDDGMTFQIAVTNTVLSFPQLGFQQGVTFTLKAEGAGVTRTSVGHLPAMNLVAALGGAVTIEATKDSIVAKWDGKQVCSVARPSGASVCNTAGFKMSMNTPAGTLPVNWDSSYLDFRLLSWDLTAITRPTEVTRKFVGIANRKVYAESSEGVMGASAVDTEQLADVPIYSAAHCNGNLFILDGTTPYYYSPQAASNRIRAWTARKGVVEKTAKIVVNWRNRLVLADTTDAPQVLFMSRQDDPWDFDYAQDDAQTALNAEDYQLGRVPDAITALCPSSDGRLFVGSTGTVWELVGDPAAGGRLIELTRETGILSQTAWCSDPTGAVYFLGSQGMFYAIGGGRPKNLTAVRIPGLGKVSAIRPGHAAASGDVYAIMAYDGDLHGINIWLAPYTSGAATHYFFDLRTNSFWPEKYITNQGPTAAAYYNAYTPAYRKTILGGRDARLYKLDTTKAFDRIGGTTGGTTGFSSYCVFGPYQLAGGVQDCVMTGLKPVLSLTSDGARYAILAAHTAEGCVKASPFDSGTLIAGENPMRPRVRACSHALKVYANPADLHGWAMEDMVCEIVPAGRCRA